MIEPLAPPVDRDEWITAALKACDIPRESALAMAVSSQFHVLMDRMDELQGAIEAKESTKEISKPPSLVLYDEPRLAKIDAEWEKTKSLWTVDFHFLRNLVEDQQAKIRAAAEALEKIEEQGDVEKYDPRTRIAREALFHLHS